MTLTEALAAFQSAMEAMKAITGEVTALRQRVVDLEAKVATHDAQLKPAPEPGPKES